MGARDEGDQESMEGHTDGLPGDVPCVFLGPRRPSLVGAGGTAGYLINKGEEGESSQKKEPSQPEEKPLSKTKVDQEAASRSREKARQKLILQLGSARG